MKKFIFTKNHLLQLRDKPHLLGYLVGKTKLTDLHSKWIVDSWTSCTHYPLQAHRGAYKTSAVTEIGIVWWLLFHPNDRIALIRKPYTEAAKTLSAIQKYFKVESVKAIFEYAHGISPSFVTKKEGSLVFNFKSTITKEGSIDAYSVDGALTGNHYDKIVCDDVVTLRDRLSKAERERTKEGLREVLTNIIDPGKQVIMVGTPWHKKDAWDIFPPAIKYRPEDTHLLSQGELEEKRRTTTSDLFACNYLLEHITPDNNTFTDPQYGEWQQGITPIYAQLDAKYSGNHTGALTIMARRRDGKIQGTGFIFHENVKQKIDWIYEIYTRFKCSALYNETNPDKGYTADICRKKGMKVHEYAEHENKHNKIIAYLKGEWNNVIWDSATQDEYMEQIIDYREGQEPDDAADSAASCLCRAFVKKNDSYKSLWE